MRRIVRLSAFLAIFSLLASCRGAEEAKVLTLTASPTSILADGSQTVQFTATFNGTDVTASEGLTLICNVLGVEREIPADEGFRTFTPGTYIFTASYDDVTSTVLSNQVTVTATSATDGRSWHHNAFFMQFTSIGCSNCPVMSSGIKTLQEEMGDNLVVASFHTHYGGYSDPMALDITDTYLRHYEIAGLPQAIVSLRRGGVNSMLTDMRGAVQDELSSHDPACGISIAADFDGSEINILVSCVSDVTAAYRYIIFLVEDGIEYMQFGTDENPYVHNNVVRATRSSNIFGERLNRGTALIPGTEYSTTWSVSLDAAWNPRNMRVVAAILASDDGGVNYYCDNVAECPVGSKVDYRYE